MLLNQPRTTVFLRRACALTAFSAATLLGAGAQVTDQPATRMPNSSLFALNSAKPMDLAALAGVDYSSSSSSVDTSMLEADPGSLNLSAAEGGMQPPTRRRYGSPRYNDKSHNADGSNKLTFVGAFGFELPTGDAHHYFNTSYAFQVGAGRQFSKKFAILAQFDYDKFGVNSATLDTQTAIYLGSPCTPETAPNDGCGTSIGANNHIWSFTLDPTYTFAAGDKYGAYVVGGVGFYHKVTNFTTPETGCYYDYFGNCYPVTENSTFDHYTSNAPGFSGGLGLTYKFSRFADERFFIEGRYVFIDNSQRPGYLYAGPGLVAPSGSNADPNSVFPANSNRTTYIPIKVGIRF